MKSWLLLLVVCVLGCEPKFQGQGPLLLEGSAYTPVKCHVLAPRATGIEVSDASGVALSLVLPPVTVRAWEELSGAAEAKLTAPGKAAVGLGACAKLTLEGEGYHAEGKRAVSGSATLDCPQLKGTFTFSGCF